MRRALLSINGFVGGWHELDDRKGVRIIGNGYFSCVMQDTLVNTLFCSCVG